MSTLQLEALQLLLMQLGSEGVFVGSGIFKSENPQKMAKAIVLATTYYNDPKKLSELSVL